MYNMHLIYNYIMYNTYRQLSETRKRPVSLKLVNVEFLRRQEFRSEFSYKKNLLSVPAATDKASVSGAGAATVTRSGLLKTKLLDIFAILNNEKKFRLEKRSSFDRYTTRWPQFFHNC